MPGRLSSALAGIGVVGLAYFLGRRFFAQPILFVSGLAISTNVAFYESGRAAQTDMPLQFFVLVAAVLAVEGHTRRGPLQFCSGYGGICGGGSRCFDHRAGGPCAAGLYPAERVDRPQGLDGPACQ